MKKRQTSYQKLLYEKKKLFSEPKSGFLIKDIFRKSYSASSAVAPAGAKEETRLKSIMHGKMPKQVRHDNVVCRFWNKIGSVILNLFQDLQPFRDHPKLNNFSLLTALVLSVSTLLYFFFTVIAAPPTTKYNPGDTLSPTCAPGDTNCSVYSPLTNIDGKATSTSSFLVGATSWEAPTNTLTVVGSAYFTGNFVTSGNATTSGRLVIGTTQPTNDYGKIWIGGDVYNSGNSTTTGTLQVVSSLATGTAQPNSTTTANFGGECVYSG